MDNKNNPQSQPSSIASNSSTKPEQKTEKKPMVHGPQMRKWMRASLVAYFFFLIVMSGYLLVYHWQLTDQQQLIEKHPETRFILLAGVFGIMGSSVHGVASLTAWAGYSKLEKSWGWWYLVRPPIGLALAIIIYFVLRAGLLSGTTVQFSYYGVAAVSAIAGLSTEHTLAKLRDVLDKLFGIESKKVGQKAEDKSHDVSNNS